jgi:pimeloyl-ACP methyl ester carboxylesterase
VSFGPIKQITAGVLDVGYVDVGPPDGPAVVLLHGWPYDIHTFARGLAVAGGGWLPGDRPVPARLRRDALCH